MHSLHPTAIIDPAALLGRNVSVGPFSVIGPNVVIGDDCVIHNHATVTGWTTLGRGVQIFPGAVVGGAPQDLKHKGERTFLEVGDNTVIRECATLHLGTALGGGKTVVGQNNLLMAYTHVAHDCRVGSNIVLANCAQLAGHVVIEDGARISGLVAVHHFVTIGACAFVAPSSKISVDAPPFTLFEGNPAKIKTLNKEAMRRRGLSEECQLALKGVFRLCFREEMARDEALRQIESNGYLKFPEVVHFVEFLNATSRGRNGRALEAKREIVPANERDGRLNFKSADLDKEQSEAE